MAINQIGTIGSLAPSRSIFETLEKSGKTNGGSIPFADYLKQSLESTNSLLTEADYLADAFAAGETDNILQVVLAAEKADVALQFTLQIRNKIMDAYSEIMRMQL